MGFLEDAPNAAWHERSTSRLKRCEVVISVHSAYVLLRPCLWEKHPVDERSRNSIRGRDRCITVGVDMLLARCRRGASLMYSDLSSIHSCVHHISVTWLRVLSGEYCSEYMACLVWSLVESIALLRAPTEECRWLPTLVMCHVCVSTYRVSLRATCLIRRCSVRNRGLLRRQE